MIFFHLFTILCSGLLIGNELTVSLFINPVISQLDSRPRAHAISLFARLLGKAMPFWYALCFLLLLAETALHRHETVFTLLIVASALWAATIVFSVTTLVPINNRIASLSPETALSSWDKEHHHWDVLHRWRIGLLLIAFACAVYAMLATHQIATLCK
jgi:hypothetical protein